MIWFYESKSKGYKIKKFKLINNKYNKLYSI